MKRRKVEVNFTGGNVTSNGGVMLLREVDRKLGLTAKVASRIPDPRERWKVDHDRLRLLRQRVYALAIGDEDLNDHGALRHDLALQTAVESDKPLASASTLCRFEHWATGFTAQVIHEEMLEAFIRSYKRAPKELVLDFDSTPAVLHGGQECRFFHGFYDEYCYLPLYVFSGRHLLVAYLRPADRDGAFNAGAILRLLVRRLRQEWPDVQVVFRADSGFCRSPILRWCDRNGVDYVVGIQKNDRLKALGGKWIERAKRKFLKTRRKSRLFGSFKYAAHTWDRKRKVIIRSEHGEDGSNPRFIVTSLPGGKKALYEDVYCARGDAENRIKEQKSLFATRMSCHEFASNQLRVLLAGLAYVLVNALRELALKGTLFETALAETIRLKLLKIGGVVVRNTRRIRVMLSTACPNRAEFIAALTALTS
jgi:hypothetical protein